MTHNLEYKRALSPQHQRVATLLYEIKMMESEIIEFAKTNKTSTSGIEAMVKVMNAKTDELLNINLNVHKIRE